MTEVYCHKVITDILGLHAELISIYPSELTVIEVLTAQSQTLLEGFKVGDNRVGVQLSNWLPEAVGGEPTEILKMDLDLNDMQLCIAREHGFASWEIAEQIGDVVLDKQFELAVDAALSGNVKSLALLIADRPELVTQYSQYGHQATLLIYLAANGVETWRQVVPRNAVEVMDLLVRAGADVHAKAQVYGGAYNVLDLLQSSAHPQDAGIMDDMVAYLKGALA